MSAGVCAEMGQMMKRRLLIFGCSGHGKVIWDLARKMKRYEEICFLDDNPHGRGVMGAPLIGGREFADFKAADELIVAIGNCGIRGKVQKYFADKGMKIATLVHPNSTIGAHVTLGRGTVVMAGAVINSETQIGEGCIINTASSVDHDCVLGTFCHVAVGAHVAGGVHVGDFTWIGAGAVVSNHISICADSLIGAGAVVVRDIEKPGTYMGVPARRKEPENRRETGGKVSFG